MQIEIIKISDEAQQAATKCRKELSCLSDDREDMCIVEDCVKGDVHFVKCLNHESCLYQYAFGDKFVCCCPVRKELFNKYKI